MFNLFVNSQEEMIDTIKVGILGGKDFGKSNFIVSLLNLPLSKDDAIKAGDIFWKEAATWINLKKGRKSLNKRRQAFLKGTAKAPKEEQLEIFTFNYYISDTEYWRFELFVYPENIYESIDSQQNISNKLEKKDKRILQKISEMDAFIFLIPADIRNDKSKIVVLSKLEGVIRHILKQKEKRISTCFAINNWEQQDEWTMDEILKQEPYSNFKDLEFNSKLCFFKTVSISKYSNDHVSHGYDKRDLLEIFFNLREHREYDIASSTDAKIETVWKSLCFCIQNFKKKVFKNKNYEKHLEQNYATGKKKILKPSLFVIVFTLIIVLIVLLINPYIKLSNVRVKISSAKSKADSGLDKDNLIELKQEFQAYQNYLFDKQYAKWWLGKDLKLQEQNL